VFKLVGFYVKVEYHISDGCILVLYADHFIYLVEYKLNGIVDETLHQINEKTYALLFVSDFYKLFKIGVL